jgi:tetratricopeptide (TPR) repeat protein
MTENKPKPAFSVPASCLVKWEHKTSFDFSMKLHTLIGRYGLGACLGIAALALASCRQSPEAQGKHFLERGAQEAQKKDYANAVLDFKNAARTLRNNPEPYYQLGLISVNTGDYPSAVAYLRKAIDLDPQHRGAQLKLIELMNASQSPELLKQAAGMERSLMSRSPRDPEVLTSSAITEILQQKPADAQKHLEQVLSEFPSNLQSAKALAVLKLSANDVAGAEEVLKSAAASAPKETAPALALARLYLLVGKKEAAEEQLQRSLTIDPSNEEALLDLARLQVATGRNADAEKTFVRISALPERQYLPLHALFLLRTGSYDQGLKELQDLVNRNPKDKNLKAVLTDAYIGLQRYQEAQKLVDSQLRASPADRQALLQRALLSLREQKFDLAEADVRQVLQNAPESALAHYLKAKVDFARGRTLEQRQELAEAIRLDPRLLAARVELAGALAQSNGAAASLDLLDHAPSDQAQLPLVVVQRNWILMQIGKTKEAKANVEQALNRVRTPELLLQDGLLLLHEGDIAKSQAVLNEAIQDDPSDPRLLDALGATYLVAKKPDEALRAVEQHVQQHPPSAPFQYLLGQWRLRLGKLTDAKAAFNTAKTLDSNFTPAYLQLALAQLALNDKAEARKTLEAASLLPTGRAQAQLMLGMLDEQDGHMPEATEHFRQAIEVDPNNVLALNNLAYRLSNNLNSLDEGFKYAEQAKALDPDNPLVNDTLGWVCYKRGLYPAAVQFLELAVSKQPAALHKYHLAMAYLMAGNEAKGQATLEEARKMDPNLPEAVMASEVASRVIKPKRKAVEIKPF